MQELFIVYKYGELSPQDPKSSMSLTYYLAIIGTDDSPIYELVFSSFKGSNPGTAAFLPNIDKVLPFIANLALDLVDDAHWLSPNLYLGKVDAFYGLLVNAYLTQGNLKFVLCHDGGQTADGVSAPVTQSKHDDVAIRQFFVDVHDLTTKCVMNPFYNVNDAITSPDFDYKVKVLAKKYL